MSPIRLSLRCALTLLLAACGPGLPQPTPAHLAVARQTDPDTTLEDLSRGRAAYAAKCGNCHALREPASEPAGQWPAIVAEMREKQGVRLTPEENRDVLRYLQAVASAPP